ncbi:uncharacterized protein LOC117171708 isoform X2 [Belonocnema kinseyi]|uniref:uncharacterized protein LOC117171708 isoform X2 n=1 Tax=Belonocnema kinseyi TaxID=2817044 RepID=UPI00143D300D|nr:uncharacterized protein LOC117171708 isoform X2 [Belonocnema kinseyi]
MVVLALSNVSGENFPQIFTIDGPFDLLDPGNSFSGRIYVNIALANYGRYVEARHFLQEKSFIFKNSLQEPEFECSRTTTPEYGPENVKIDPQTLERIPDVDWSCSFQEVIENFIKHLIVILPSSKYLSAKKPLMKTVHISLKKAELPKEKKGKKKKK